VSALPADALRSMAGIDLIRAMFAGDLPRAPIAVLLGFEGGDVGEGWVEFNGTPGSQHYNPLGTVHGGYAATLLDTCMGCAVHTTLKVGIGFTTIDMNVTYLRPMSANTGLVTARGEVITSGRRVATARGTLTDERGKLIATATTSCLVFPIEAAL